MVGSTLETDGVKLGRIKGFSDIIFAGCIEGSVDACSIGVQVGTYEGVTERFKLTLELLDGDAVGCAVG